MAEESINSLITPEKNETDVKKMDSNSAENPSDEKATTKRRVPIYLRGSTSSCHDMCKYGKHHAFEEKPRESLRERISKSSSPKEHRSAKVIVKEGRFEEKAVEPLRARIPNSSLPDQMKSVKMTIPGHKNKEKSVLKDRPSLDYTKRHSLPVKISPLTKSCSPKLLCNSPKQKALPRSKTLLSDLSPAKKSSSEVSGVMKSEILLPSEKDEALVKGDRSTDGKISRSDIKTCDPSSFSPVKSRLTNVKQVSGDSYGNQTGRKVTSPIIAMDKGSEIPSVARLSTPRFSPGKATSSQTREAGRVRLSFSSSSSPKYRNGTRKSIGDDSEKTLCVIKTRMKKNVLNPASKDVGRVNLSSPLKSNCEDSEKTLCVIKTETENHASLSPPTSISMPHAKSASLLSCEEKDENDEEIKGSGNGTDEIVSEKTASVETRKIRSSLPREDDDEKIDEFIYDEIISLESGKLQPTMPSSHEEIYPSSSSSSSESSCVSSLEEGINSKVQYVKETRKILKRSKSVISDGKSRVPVKLNFRRGKIIDLQPENNIPKRLRFRRRAGTVGNKVEDSAPDIKKYMEMGHVKAVSPNKTLRKADSFVSDNKKSTDVKPGTPNKTLRKSRTSVSAEDKYRTPVNLIHRKKTVNLQTGNKSLTRLTFTRARAPRAEDGKINLRRKAMKNVVCKNDAVDCELPSRRVVLKHPEVQRKKNGQVLLNNVIKETASKLAESRKSKVKALVGAFETVISLQESKSCSH
ncbi:hypothetical protein OROGR_023556 [Orobanche gracilis]